MLGYAMDDALLRTVGIERTDDLTARIMERRCLRANLVILSSACRPSPSEKKRFNFSTTFPQLS